MFALLENKNSLRNVHLYVPQLNSSGGILRRKENGEGHQAGDEECYGREEPKNILQSNECGMHCFAGVRCWLLSFLGESSDALLMRQRM